MGSNLVMEIGYALSSEEHRPLDLVRYAKRAEEAGLPVRSRRSFRFRATSKAATAIVTEDDIAEKIVCGPDLERHLQAIEEFAAAGFDRVYVHQVGPDQDGFFDAYQRGIVTAVDDIAPKREREATVA